MYELDVGEYDPVYDSITIEGIRYSGEVFRSFGLKEMVGKKFEIIDNDDILTVKFDE